MLKVVPVKRIEDIPGIVEKWESHVRMFESRVPDFPIHERHKSCVLMNMLPAAFKREMVMKYGATGQSYGALRANILDVVQITTGTETPMDMSSAERRTGCLREVEGEEETWTYAE